MGCASSRVERERCRHCNRKAVNNLVIIAKECEICIVKATSVQHSVQYRPKFGEYRCNSCGRYWNSYLCWPNKYQICKRCHKQTLPYNYRELTATDIMKSNENKLEHASEFCQMCQQLGYSCKKFNTKYAPANSNRRNTDHRYCKTTRRY